MKPTTILSWFCSFGIVLMAAIGIAGTNNPGMIYLSGSVPYDHDATNFIARSGINPRGAEAKAIGRLVFDLKAANLWTNFYALYPFVGGTSNSCAQNLVGTNYGVTWSGTNTFNAYGVTGDGVSGTGDTGFKETSAGANTNNIHYYAYVMRHQAGSVGGFISAGQANAWGGVGSGSGNIGFTYPDSQGGLGVSSSIGHALATRVATNSSFGLIWVAPFRSSDFGYLSNLVGSAFTGVPTNSAKLLGNADIGGSTLGNFSKSTVSSASIGRYLNYSQATNYFAILNRFQSSLHRAQAMHALTP